MAGVKQIGSWRPTLSTLVYYSARFDKKNKQIRKLTIMLQLQNYEKERLNCIYNLDIE